METGYSPVLMTINPRWSQVSGAQSYCFFCTLRWKEKAKTKVFGTLYCNSVAPTHWQGDLCFPNLQPRMSGPKAVITMSSLTRLLCTVLESVGNEGAILVLLIPSPWVFPSEWLVCVSSGHLLLCALSLVDAIGRGHSPLWWRQQCTDLTWWGRLCHSQYFCPFKLYNPILSPFYCTLERLSYTHR